jgi:hypothetical protein
MYVLRHGVENSQNIPFPPSKSIILILGPLEVVSEHFETYAALNKAKISTIMVCMFLLAMSLNAMDSVNF